jgi:phospholipase C
MNDGQMDSFNLVSHCHKRGQYRCYTQYHPTQVPNIYALAENFALSDRMFESGLASTWGSHLEMVTGTFDGFLGYNPKGELPEGVKGWGCDSFRDALHEEPDGSETMQPACVPDYELDPAQYPYGGAYRATTVQQVPSLMDEATSVGISWRLYADWNGSYGRAICPYFGSCLYTSQRENMVLSDGFFTDAANGNLPALSFVMPSIANSQHNDQSMLAGDNWIGEVVSSVENGPDWASTAIFITWDDCGCFYDHLPPPQGSSLGIRVPLIIVSPFAKAGFTDSNLATFDSIARFAEVTLGIPSMGGADATAYDFSDSFDYSQQPIPGMQMLESKIPRWESAWLRTHPADPDDPT